MPTLQEILETDLDVGSEKTASADVAIDDPGIAALAAEIGLAGDSENVAYGYEGGEEKTASIHGSLFDDMFPDDLMSGQEKTAEHEKVAAEEALGARSYDYFAHRFDTRIEKIAAEVMQGDATVSSPKASIEGGNPHKDSRPPQTQPDNRPSDAGSGIGTDGTVDNRVTAQKGSEVVGREEQKTASAEEIYNLAVRKAVLQNMVG